MEKSITSEQSSNSISEKTSSQQQIETLMTSTTCQICHKEIEQLAQLSCCNHKFCLECILYNQQVLATNNCHVCQEKYVYLEKINIKKCSNCQGEIDYYITKNKKEKTLCKTCYNKSNCWGCGIAFTEIPEKSIINKPNDPFKYCERCFQKRYCKNCGNQNYTIKRRSTSEAQSSNLFLQLQSSQQQQQKKKDSCFVCHQIQICQMCEKEHSTYQINKTFYCSPCFYRNFCSFCGKTYENKQASKFYIKQEIYSKNATNLAAAMEGNCCLDCYKNNQQQKCFECKTSLLNTNSNKINDFEYYCDPCYKEHFICQDCNVNEKSKNAQFCGQCQITCQLCLQKGIELNYQRICKKCFKDFYCFYCETNLIMLKTQYKKYEGKFFCNNCFYDNFCNHCKESLVGNYVTKCDGKYCRKCVRSIFCKKCDKKSSTRSKQVTRNQSRKRKVSYILNGEVLHGIERKDLYDQQYCDCHPICENCGKRFVGKYVNTTTTKNIYCNHCKIFYWKNLQKQSELIQMQVGGAQRKNQDSKKRTSLV